MNSDSKKNTCPVDPNDEKPELAFDYADEAEIKQPLDVTALLIATTGGRQMKIDTCAQEFRDREVPLPELEVDWKGEVSGETQVAPTPQKRKASEVESLSPPASNAFASSLA